MSQPAPPRVEPIKMEHLRSTKHDDYFVLRDGAAGLFLAASKFPIFVKHVHPKLLSFVA